MAVLGLRFCARAFSSCGKWGHSSSRCTGLSLSRPLLLRSTGSRRAGSAIVAHGPSCSMACGIFPVQGSNPCPLHWQADSQPLRHQGSPSSFLTQAFTAINVPLSTAFTAFHTFPYVVFSFLFVSRYLKISLVISSLTLWLRVYCLISTFSLLSVVDFQFHYTVIGKGTLYDFDLLKFIDLFYGLTYILSWRMFHLHLRKIRILFLGECSLCLLGPVG